MRKVIYREWVRGIETEEYKKADPFHRIGMNQFKEGTGCNVEKEGLFHGFFPAAMESDDGSFGNFTEALIETADGNIVNVHPSLIRFVDTPESEQRAEFAKAAMQGYISSGNNYKMTELINLSILCADELIAELKLSK